MISKAMQDAINEQINKEMFSSYLYLSMAAHFEGKNLPGFGNWLRIQAAEENEHAMKLYDFLLERGGKVELKAIAAPKQDWASAMEAVKEVLAHEQLVTKSIHDLYEVALKEKDYATQVMLHWFIEEQVEEEANAGAILDDMQRIEAHDTAILMLDHRLAKRKGE
ncbi:MAG TPA: ferritin [Anaerolineae bacterium]|jgi:ferritin|nr:ferritin [Anaerolineae bacterium]HAE59381.1 ferritin [Anaerolineae bacterium]